MRLIDADALKEELRNSWIRKAKMPMEADPFLAFAMSDIDNAPTIDAVEVVRCKECRKWTEVEDGTGVCNMISPYMIGIYGYDYCSFGERREDE